MTDDLHQSLSAWTAPPPSAAARERVDALFDDASLSGPSATSRPGAALLPVAYGLVVGILLSMTWPSRGSDPVLKAHGVSTSAAVVVMPGLPATSQVTATAVSTVDLRGYEPIQQPRIQIVRSGS